MVEAAPNVRAALTARYAGDKTDHRAHARAGGGAVRRLLRFHRHAFGGAVFERRRARAPADNVPPLLKPDGLFVLGDIVPPKLAAPAAAATLLRFGAANGFFWAALAGLLRIFVSDYLTLRKTIGLSHYTQAAMLEKLKAAGFSAQRAARNIGHNQWRMTFLGATRVTRR